MDNDSNSNNGRNSNTEGGGFLGPLLGGAFILYLMYWFMKIQFIILGWFFG